MMKTKRSATTTERVNALLSKEEPSFVGMMELDKTEIILALNWYSQNKDRDHSQKYLEDYCKANALKVSSQQIKLQVPTLGFVCRMLSRGAILDKKSKVWFQTKLNDMQAPSVADALFDAQETTPAAPVPKPATIQDRLKAQSSKCMGDLEGAIDEFILSDFKKTPNTLEVMREHDMKGAHGPNIVNFFKKYRDEFRVAIAGKDEQLNEGYSNYTVPQMKKMEALYDQIISDALTVMGESMAAREPRAKKVKSPEVQVKNLKFCPQDEELNITSIPPTRIVGAEGVWLFHRKNRMLSYYAADDAAGLGVKGCALTNYSKTKSRTKKVRKPEDILQKIVKDGKVYLKNIMDTLTTKDGKINGRLGKDTLLVRVIA